MELTTILETASMTLLLGSISLLAGWKLLKQRVYTAGRELASQLIGELITEIMENPEKLKPVMQSLIKVGMGELGLNKAKNSKIKGMGFEIPVDSLSTVAQLLPLAKQFLSGAGTAKDVAETVFG